MIVEFAKSFEERFCRLPHELQTKCRSAIAEILDAYQTRQFPKGLRLHKCGPFLSISITLRHRIFALPIPGGLKFSFVGDHRDMEKYLRRRK